jgi:hypothetical protein
MGSRNTLLSSVEFCLSRRWRNSFDYSTLARCVLLSISTDATYWLLACLLALGSSLYLIFISHSLSRR